METLIINQQTKINYTRNLQQVIKRVVNTMAQTLKLTANTEVSIMIVDNDYIQELNFIYRGQYAYRCSFLCHERAGRRRTRF